MLLRHGAETNAIKQFIGAFCHGGVGPTPIHQHGHHHVLLCGERGYQVMVLKNEPYGFASQAREFGVSQDTGILAVDEQPSVRWTVEQANNIQQRALA